MSVTPTNANASEATVRGGLRRRLAFGAMLASVAAGLLSGGSVSSAVAADTCVNAAVRVQTGSTGLPDCRAYEMVSAPYKEGFPLLPGGSIGFTEGGVVSYQSRGALAGNALGSPSNLYHATRSVEGWVTSSLDPPGTIYSTSLGETAAPVLAESADLRWSLWRMFRRDGESEGDAGYWLRGSDGAFTRVGDYGGLNVSAVSAATFSHVVVIGSGAPLSEYVGTGNVGRPRPVAINNSGQPTQSETCLRDISSDGRVIVFISGCDGQGIPQVWARVGASASVLVSGSECTREADDDGGLCNGVSTAAYAGAAVDGSRVFLTTSQQLVNGDTDQTNDLYACDIPDGSPVPVSSANPCTTLTRVSEAATGEAVDAQVESVVSVSDDGSRVYFVAKGVLAGNLDVGGVNARVGADNLYVWDRDAGHPAGETRYVARLADPGNDLTRAQMTSDGRYLLFVTANRIAPGDVDSSKDVYRYDAGTHAIVRVSASVAGGGGNLGFDAVSAAGPAMSADGSTVIFDTAEALSPSDSNGVNDVYSWRDGQVSLISSGGGGSTVGVTSSGRDIFFGTDAPVLGADRDANADIYDARIGGGFAPAPKPPPCFGDQCQGERSQGPSLAGPSAVGSGGGLAGVAPVFSVRTVSAAQRRALAATGKISLTVTTNTAGTINASATATIAGRSATVGSGRQTLTAPGRVAVALTLSRKARAQLASRGRLTVNVAVHHSKVALDRSVTLKLVQTKAKTKSAGRAQRSVAGVGGGRS